MKDLKEHIIWQKLVSPVFNRYFSKLLDFFLTALRNLLNLVLFDEV